MHLYIASFHYHYCYNVTSSVIFYRLAINYITEYIKYIYICIVQHIYIYTYY